MCSKSRPTHCRPSTGTVNPSTTPATVECTPLACTSPHVAIPSGTNSHQRPKPRWTANANSPCGDQRQRQRSWREVVGVEDGDDDDGEQVVDHGQGQQERTQGGRQMAGQHREHRQRERDIGGSRHRPADHVLRMAACQVDHHEDRRGHQHAADRRQDRQRGPARIAQIAGDELALELQSDDEEEDRQEAVGRPRRDAQPQMQRFGAERELRHRLIGVRPRRISPPDSHSRCDEQQHAANGFLTQNPGEPLGL